jgi:2'-5' RNA ligase
MSLFVAIDLPPQIKKKFLPLYESLKQIQEIRPVNPNNLQVVLKFEDKLNSKELIQKLKQIKINPILIEIEGFGFYPNPKEPRVLAFKINNSKELDELIKELDNKKFSPYITITRLKNPSSEIINELIDLVKDFKKQSFKLENIKLYESRNTELGSIHTLIETF